jgi:hypothetical protein
MARETFTDDEFDQLEREVAAIFFPPQAEEVDTARDDRISRILRRVEEQGSDSEEG